MRILIVDEDEPAARVLGVGMTAYGFTCAVVVAVDAAILALHQFGPHCVVFEPRRRDAGGSQLAGALRLLASQRAVALVAVGSGPEPPGWRDGFGLQGYLVKPVRPRDLLALLVGAATWPR